MSRLVLFSLAAFVAILLAGYAFLSKQKTPPVVPETIPKKSPIVKEDVTSESANKVFSLSEVSQHAQAEDCWLAIEGKVYDVTSFISQGKHPGGEAIITGCGKDATAMFNKRPNDGTSHSVQARSLLPEFYLGELSQ